jgi:hypothetical protein
MSFPTKSLLVLLDFARGKVEFNSDVFDAAIEVLKYIYDEVKVRVSGAHPHMTAEKALEEILAKSAGEADPVQMGPGLWITIGVFILEVVLKKVLN